MCGTFLWEKPDLLGKMIVNKHSLKGLTLWTVASLYICEGLLVLRQPPAIDEMSSYHNPDKQYRVRDCEPLV